MRSDVRVVPGPPFAHDDLSALSIGAIAQLGERLLCKHQVVGSIPTGSTKGAALGFTLGLELPLGGAGYPESTKFCCSCRSIRDRAGSQIIDIV